MVCGIGTALASDDDVAEVTWSASVNACGGVEGGIWSGSRRASGGYAAAEVTAIC